MNVLLNVVPPPNWYNKGLARCGAPGCKISLATWFKGVPMCERHWAALNRFIELKRTGHYYARDHVNLCHFCGYICYSKLNCKRCSGRNKGGQLARLKPRTHTPLFPVEAIPSIFGRVWSEVNSEY